jgi:hypothetical protein
MNEGHRPPRDLATVAVRWESTTPTTPVFEGLGVTVSLFQDGLRKALAGTIAYAELLRVAEPDVSRGELSDLVHPATHQREDIGRWNR